MTGTNDKIRSLFLVAIMVMSVFAMSVAFTGSVAAQDRTMPANAAPPVTAFVGESLDISGVTQTGGGTIGGGTVGLSGVSGDADGEFLQDSGTDFSFENAPEGGYDADGDDSPEVFVTQAAIEDVTLYRGANTNGADVTDGSVPSGVNEVTIEVDYNFDSQTDPVQSNTTPSVDFTEWAYVQVLDGSGTFIAGELGWSNPALLPPAPGIVTSSGSTVTATGLSGLDAGETYTFAAGGLPTDSATGGSEYPDSLGDSPFDDSPMTATLEITDPGETISLRSTDVTQGASVTGDVTGAPGENVFVRVPETNTANTATSGTVFRNTGDVVNRADDTHDSVAYHEAELGLGGDGEASFQVNTGEFDADTTSTFEITPTLGGSVEDDVDLSVNAPSISITDMPNAVVIGDEFTINGEAVQSDEVKAWVKIGDTYEELNDGNDNDADASVQSDGTFEIDVDSGEVMDLEGAYRIVVTADEAGNPDGPGAGVDTTVGDIQMTGEELNALDVYTTQSIRANTGAISARLSSDTIATDDELTLEGEALGQGNALDLLVVGPRGGVTDAQGNALTADDLMNADSVSVDDQEFSVDLTAFDLRGTYQVFVIGSGRNGNMGLTNAPSTDVGGHTQSEAVEIIEDAYDQPGEDNVIVTRTVQAQNPQLTIDEFRTNGQVAQGELDLSGQSNREDETLVFLEVLDENDDVVAASEGEVNGTNGTWSGSIDLSDVDPGDYTLRADDDSASANVEFELVNETTTPTATPTEQPETATPTEQPETATPTEADGGTDTPTATPTETQPGFGLVVALLALIGAALLAVRRSS